MVREVKSVNIKIITIQVYPKAEIKVNRKLMLMNWIFKLDLEYLKIITNSRVLTLWMIETPMFSKEAKYQETEKTLMLKKSSSV